ncbi:cell division protein FtsL [Salibacterium salarium]|uniref:Cell division protein FtsL n=1 Tax=Salibacterium salarium TaxID=284579 RepID=A0A3R9WQC6_9BACI|nr:cell division protein FtsL [Salibacterium salarium]MDQ0299035.1 cell division protein FtsL [Salibacterium salarium]RSL31339.1 cell division protein FtsL [Salibacterium salarium]
MDNLAQQLQRQKQQTETVHTHVQQHQIPGKISKGEKVIFSAMIIAVLIASVFVVTNYANIYTQEREISNLNQSINEQTEMNRSLELEVSELSSPDRIMYYAKEELGMELDDKQVKVIQGATP